MTYHCQVDAAVVLKSIQQADQPIAFCSSQDITLGQDVSHFVKLEEKLLAHDLESADFSGVLLLSQEYLSISSLSDLCKDRKVTLPQSRASIAEIRPFSAQVLREVGLILAFIGLGWGWVVFLESCHSRLTGVDVAEEVVIVIKEICHALAIDA